MSAFTPRVLVIGSANMDMVLPMECLPKTGETVMAKDIFYLPGGKGANTAVACARLGAQTQFVGAVGADAHGAALRHSLSAAGVGLEGLQTLEAPTGIAVIPVDREGQNTITVIGGANAALTPEAMLRGVEACAAAGKSAARGEPARNEMPRTGPKPPPAGLDAVLLQLELPDAVTAAAMAWANKNKVFCVLDAGPARGLDFAALGRIDLFTPNQTECKFFTGLCPVDEEEGRKAAAALFALGDFGLVLIKMGAQGAMLYDGKTHIYQPVFPVNAVDATAAGDAFTAAFVTEYFIQKKRSAAAADAGERSSPLQGAACEPVTTGGLPQGAAVCFDASALRAALRFAAAAGAVTAGRRGAQPALPTRAETEAFLRERAAKEAATG